ncbi:hypothetical protein CY34DRAFT_95694 [Suillus luteus UH-Slu-Lm8-n1]|uniref:Uncharacterized protein n=1 Tax=Suillus luteus UH-Slu-Lm8-n1 TaxID=930992 RepID=A0A0D0AUX3_9AGAM|nr:hypothetical protein CY34DRAFT_95694 [Suillus luteus UH-Slu-Lm8-n1]
MLDGHKRRLTSRNLRQLHRHPYARTGTTIDPKVALFQPDCPRNGRRLCAPPRWQRQATSIRSNSFITSDALIAIIASARLDSTSSSLDTRLWVTNAVSYLKTPDRVELAGGSIEQTIARCHSISIQTTGSSLVAMITYMQLAIQCQSIIDSSTTENHTIRKIYNDQVARLKDAPLERTFQRWHENGCKFIMLAAGGSFFLLLIIAGLEIRWKITTIRFDVLRQVAKMLRQPGTTNGGLSLCALPVCTNWGPLTLQANLSSVVSRLLAFRSHTNHIFTRDSGVNHQQYHSYHCVDQMSNAYLSEKHILLVVSNKSWDW